MRIRQLLPILGLAASLASPASAQNPGELHWRQKTGIGMMLAGVAAIGIAHERHPPDPLRQTAADRRGRCRSRRRHGAAATARTCTARRNSTTDRMDYRKNVVVGYRKPGHST